MNEMKTPKRSELSNSLKKTKKLFLKCLGIWLVYVLICMTIPPVFHKKSTGAEKMADMPGRAMAQEKVLSIDSNMDALLWRLRLIEAARERVVSEMEQERDILIQTPYVICSREMYQDLKRICADGSKAEMIINAVEGGANPFGCTDYLNQKKNVRETGRLRALVIPFRHLL